ncbi:MAG: hypothetical protein OXU45_05170 [Candidatus Melainabacteria bacterium]|nr:hypothetical protein [Candidatus Melainabacteria bacterium]
MKSYIKILAILVLAVFGSWSSALAEIKPPNPLWQKVRVQKDAHQVKFIAGDEDDGSFYVSVPYNVPTNFDSYKLYITPQYRSQKLAVANRRINKKINKLEAKIKKNKSKKKDTAKLEKKLVERKQDLYQPPSWDQSNDLTILHFARKSGFGYLPGKPVRHLLLTNKDKLVCVPKEIKSFKLSKDDRHYLIMVYGTYPHKKTNDAFIARYKPECIISQNAFKEVLKFNSVSYDQDFFQSYGVSKYTKAAIREDLKN